jgi:hypothetical protein
MLGFDRVHAQPLAECGDVDLGRLRRLIAGGCDLCTVDWAGSLWW